jgi:hypothetical protein
VGPPSAPPSDKSRLTPALCHLAHLSGPALSSTMWQGDRLAPVPFARAGPDWASLGAAAYGLAMVMDGPVEAVNRTEDSFFGIPLREH